VLNAALDVLGQGPPYTRLFDHVRNCHAGEPNPSRYETGCLMELLCFCFKTLPACKGGGVTTLLVCWHQLSLN
jgi:hypothetical protein